MYEVLYNTKSFLTRDELQLVNKHCQRLGDHYQWLAVSTMERGVRRWSMRPELHYMCAHLPEQAKLINPVYCQRYRSESMVGKVTTIYNACQSGPFHTKVQSTVVNKYWLGMISNWAPERIE